MNIFVTGTDTHIGKTLVSAWLCLHSGFDYFKPIQTGYLADSDRQTIQHLSDARTHPEAYCFKKPVSPHLAAQLEDQTITLDKIKLPVESNLIIEGAGGLLVPLNEHQLMIDLIKHLKTSVILVARTTLGTINHTLLSLEALRARNIPILGLILNGPADRLGNIKAIEHYGDIPVLATLPLLDNPSKAALQNITFPESLKTLFKK